ncbi:MAG TPA: hypothetical protein VEG42_04000 [Thermoplasmata archaeon]|nr:hypothetical protein [Thermoplasmata archaeon]
MRRWKRFLPELTVAGMMAATVAVSYPVFLVYGIVTWAQSVIWGLATLGSVLLVLAVRRSGEDWHRELRILFLVSVVIGLFSIFTGLANNSTDEPHTMPGYLAELLHGQDPYTTILPVTYSEHALTLWSATLSGNYHYVYLPLLLFFQVPGTGALGYELLCFACWGGMVYLVRKDEVAAIALVSPFVALVAANGFTDLPVLFLMTLSLRGWTGPKARAVEYLTLGMKQFANLFWLAYYVVRRDVVRAVVVVAVTLAIAAPFIVWHPTGIWCGALTFSLSPGCSSAPNSARTFSDLYSHWNYYLWILWVAVLFDGELLARGRALWAVLTSRWHSESG